MKDIHKLLLLSTLLSLCSLCACASPPTKQARLKAYAEALELQVKQVEDKPLQSEILVHSIDRDLKTLVDGAADMKDAEADVAVQYLCGFDLPFVFEGLGMAMPNPPSCPDPTAALLDLQTNIKILEGNGQTDAQEPPSHAQMHQGAWFPGSNTHREGLSVN
jgi:hypothetical protein